MSENQGTPSRAERILVYAVAGIIGISVLSFISVLIASVLGLERSAFTSGMWPLITAISYVGLPTGFLLIIILMIMGIIRRRSQDPSGSNKPSAASHTNNNRKNNNSKNGSREG